MRLGTKPCLAATTLALLIFTACNRAPTIEWHQVDAPDGAFSVTFPGNPVKEDNLTNSATGGTFVSHSFKTRSSKSVNASYACAWWEDPTLKGRTTEQIIDSVGNNGLSGLQGELLEEKRLTIQGHPARDIRAIIPGHDYDNRIVLVGNRVYSLMIVGRKRDSMNVEKFFNSFILH
jgi:hypothetical protein